MNGMKRSSLAALLLVALALPLVARSLGATHPLAQIPLTPSRAQRYVFEPWTEEERAFYQTFQIAYALRGLAPLERWEQEPLSADSLLKAAQVQVAARKCSKKRSPISEQRRENVMAESQ